VSSPSPVPSPAAVATTNPTSGEAEGRPKRKRTRRTKKSADGAADGAAAATGKTRKPKKGKDGSDQPKKPVVLNGYMRWLVADGRNQVISANSGMKTTEVAKECGRLWNKMSKEEQKKWSAPK
jgi:hypothetical protein